MTAILTQSLTSDTYILLHSISWSQFQQIETAFNNIAGVRFIYLDNVLEIMTLSPEHEEAKCLLRALLEAYLRENNIRFYGRGSATLGGKALGARKEPDESYNIGSKKSHPDLVIEVIVTSGGIDKLALYKRLSIPEVWFWQDGVLSVYYLKKEYEKVEKSELFPELNLSLLAKYMTYYDQYDAVTEFLQAHKQEDNF
jgi:Uma2 family endonuclease